MRAYEFRLSLLVLVKYFRVEVELSYIYVVFPCKMQCHIIYESDIAEDLRNILEEDDLAVVLSSKHRPRCIIEFISQSLKLVDINPTKLQMLVTPLPESSKHQML